MLFAALCSYLLRGPYHYFACPKGLGPLFALYCFLYGKGLEREARGYDFDDTPIYENSSFLIHILLAIQFVALNGW